jgi:hypothetical protein
MEISLEQAAAILNRSVDEVLYIANVENRLAAKSIIADDISYNEDGTVKFAEELEDPKWAFDLNDVLEFKVKMEQELVGEVEGILESK